jgi:hypothetical protein
MRLRQIAFVAEDLASAADEVEGLLGLAECFRDDSVAEWGLENVVYPIGTNFLEIVAPTKPGTAAGRFLERRQGNAGFMVILQCDDAVAERERIAAMGVRIVWTANDAQYVGTHYHPADTGGILLAIDSVETGEAYTDPECSWHPAGSAWKEKIRTGRVQDLCAVELQSADPRKLADLWGHLLDRPVRRTGKDQFCIDLFMAKIRFVRTGNGDGRGAGIRAIDISVNDIAAVEAASNALDRKIVNNRTMICGTEIIFT